MLFRCPTRGEFNTAAVTIMFPIFKMKLLLLLYADDIIMFSGTVDGLQTGLNGFVHVLSKVETCCHYC